MMRLTGLALSLSAMSSAALASSADVSAAQRYVDRIYTELPSNSFNLREVRYAKELGALIDRDAAVPEGYVGALDFVPFCGCQDFGPDYAFTSRVVATAKGATVTVDLTNVGRQRFRIDLVDSPIGWVVADVHGPDIPSLLAFMRANVSMVPRK